MKFYLDSMIWMYYFEGHPDFFAAADALLNRIKQRHHTFVASHLILAEVLVLPRRNQDLFTAAQYRRYFLSKQVRLSPFNVDTAERFAELRARSRVKPADALHLALAASAGVDFFVTNDTKLHTLVVPGIAQICTPEAVP